MNYSTKFVQGHPHTALFGITGGGKTTLARRMVEEAKRLMIWNPMGDLGAPGDQIGAREAIRDGFSPLKSKNKACVAFNPSRHFEDEFELFCQQAFVLQAGRTDELVLLVDEIDQVYGQSASRSHPFGDIMRRGRHFNIRVIGATQHPTTVKPDFRRNCALTYIFTLGVEGPSFVQTTYKSKVGSEMVASLAKHHAIVFEVGKSEPWGYKNPPLKS